MPTRKIIDAKHNGEKVWIKGHAQAIYMSDGATVEDAIKNIKIGGGGGNSTVSIDVSALFTYGGTINVNLEELTKHILYADGATVTCIPKLDEGKVILDRSVITNYGSVITSRRDCAIVSGDTSSVTTLEVRTKNYDLP